MRTYDHYSPSRNTHSKVIVAGKDEITRNGDTINLKFGTVESNGNFDLDRFIVESIQRYFHEVENRMTTLDSIINGPNDFGKINWEIDSIHAMNGITDFSSIFKRSNKVEFEELVVEEKFTVNDIGRPEIPNQGIKSVKTVNGKITFNTTDKILTY